MPTCAGVGVAGGAFEGVILARFLGGVKGAEVSEAGWSGPLVFLDFLMPFVCVSTDVEEFAFTLADDVAGGSDAWLVLFLAERLSGAGGKADILNSSCMSAAGTSLRRRAASVK